jgi:hypothetical protein
MVLLPDRFIPFASNVLATIFDITLPEVRSTARQLRFFELAVGAFHNGDHRRTVFLKALF